MITHKFDDTSLTWYKLDWLPDLEFYVYKVDIENKIIDILFKFAANSKVQLHRHKAPYITFVIQGELRFYRPNGELKEIRPTGSYVSGLANGEPHLEGGGDEDAIVFFSNRNVEGPLYEFLDENMQPTITLGLQDFAEQIEKQGGIKWKPAA